LNNRQRESIDRREDSSWGSIGFLGRTLISLALVFWLLSVLIVPFIHLTCVALRSIRLRTILNGLGVTLSFWWLGLAQLKGSFVGAVLPGGISGDIYRTFVIGKKTADGCNSISAVLIEKIIGIGSMLLLCMSGVLYGVYWLGHPVFIQLVQPSLIGLSLFVVVCGALPAAARLPILGQVGFSHDRVSLNEVVHRILVVFSDKAQFLSVVFVSLLIQVAIVAWYFAIARAIELNVSFSMFLVTVPIVELLLMLPISIGGIGVREGAFVLLLVPFGLELPDVVAFSLLCLTIAGITRVLSGTAFLFKL